MRYQSVLGAMQILDGYKSGGGLLFLSDDREIERDNLWAIRGLLAAVFVNAAVQSPSASGPAWAIGLLAVLLALYWAALRFLSRDESEQEDTASGGVRV